MRLFACCPEHSLVARGPSRNTQPALPHRRQVLTGLAAAGATALLPSRHTAAQAPAAQHRIDAHHHLTPPAYVEELAPMKKLTRATLDWTPARAIEQMDQGGVAISITSITTPGLWFGSHSPARRLARVYDHDPEDVTALGWQEFIALQWESIFAGYRSKTGLRRVGRRWSDLLEAWLERALRAAVGLA